MDDKKPKKEAKFVKPLNTLKQKVGHGGVRPDIISKAQTVIDDVDVDFKPMAQSFLDDLKKATELAKTSSQNPKQAITGLVESVMQLKATGGMFKYDLVSEIAHIVLHFLENINTIEDELFDIIDALEQSVQIIVLSNHIKTDSDVGKEICSELNKACQRYNEKYRA